MTSPFHPGAQPRLFALLLLVVAAVLLSRGDARGQPQDGPQAQQEAIVIPAGEPIVIGVSLPLTGPEAFAGHEDLDAVITGVQVWKDANGDTIAGHPIHLRVEDDGCTEADITLQAAQRLIAAPGLAGVIGPDCSSGAQAAIPVYREAAVVAISGSATRTDLTATAGESPYFFRTAYRNDLQGTLIGLFIALQLQANLAYLVDDSESYGQDLAATATDLLEQRGVTVVRQSVRIGTEDFTDLAAEVVGAGPNKRPDIVGFLGFNPEATLFYRQLRDAGYSGLFGAGDAAATRRGFVEPVGAAEAEGVLFSGCAVPLPDELDRAFARIHRGEAASSAFPAQYVDAVTILLDAVKQTTSADEDGSLAIDREALRATVQATDLTGVSGEITFDADGDRVPPGVRDADEVARQAVEALNLDIYSSLGLVPCQVQDGRLVNLLGPGAGALRGVD